MPDQRSKNRRYDHRRHAGNAGDVWKHLILAETAGHLLRKNRSLVYLESHAGFPCYSLEPGGEWSDGIGRCWPHLSSLQQFLYFRILIQENGLQLSQYPGSALLVKKASEISGGEAIIKLWDIDCDVECSWLSLPEMDNLKFHLGDGFSGAASALDRDFPGLLLIDPPYIESQDSDKAGRLLEEAEDAGWVGLLWLNHESSTDRHFDSVQRYGLRFDQALLYDKRWKGAEMALVGGDDELKAHLARCSADFVEAMNRCG
ncbi:MAG: 23S rRNA (adenine(2030)-N(6))-methyltransferase RlmJ [Methanotrichaceae archaeon]|nr:23S rRNA (adenine(2030)-N(6))-methyltransferase RlmJ [Methanotrichaceae archaeon]